MILRLLILLLTLATANAASSWYVSPTGSGNGTLGSPGALTTALAATGWASAIVPGDTLYLRAGTYAGAFSSSLAGSLGLPVTIRPYTGERAIIDSQNIGIGLTINGAYTWLWGLEVMNSNIPTRAESATRTTGIFIQAANCKVINTIAHDNWVGILASESATGSEFYGNISYNNGSQGDAPDRGHGHGFYVQNDTGTMLLRDNIAFNQFGNGIQCYGTAAHVNGITVDRNISWDNGVLRRDGDREINIVVDSATQPIISITVRSNYCYASANMVNIMMGLKETSALTQGTAYVTNNYSGGGQIGADWWTNLVVTGNTFRGGRGARSTGGLSATTLWDLNTYVSEGNFYSNWVNIDWQHWTNSFGYDFNSTYANANPTGIDKFVIPNTYESGRANVVIYNWNLANNVSVDFTGYIAPGASYTIKNAANYFGPIVKSGLYASGSLSLPMTNLTVATPVGVTTPAATGPQFNVFIVESSTSGAVISVTPSSRDYGAILVFDVKDLTFSVQNSGTDTLAGSASVTPPYTILSGGTYSLGAGLSQTVTVRYAPTVVGTNIGTVLFTGAAGAVAAVTGGATNLVPVIAVTPASRDVGTILINTTTNTTYGVTNTGTGILAGSASVGSPFTVISNWTYNLGAGLGTEVTVRYWPTSAGVNNGTVTFTGAAGATASITGTATNGLPVISVSPASRAFGTVAVGSSADATFTIWNQGTGPLTGTVSVPAPFSVVGTASYTIAPNATNIVTIRYTPVAALTSSATVTFTGGLGATTAVSGTGGAANLAVTPPTLAFGSVLAGTSTTLTFGLTNTGAISVTGTASAPSPYGITGGASYTLGPGLGQTVTVRFAPTTVGLVTANVNCTGANGAVVALSGIGTAPNLVWSPTSTNSASILTNTTKDVVMVLSNTGTASVTSNLVTVLPFVLVSPAAFTIDAGASSNITVRFVPTAAGAFSRSLTALGPPYNPVATLSGTATNQSAPLPPTWFNIFRNGRLRHGRIGPIIMKRILVLLLLTLPLLAAPNGNITLQWSAPNPAENITSFWIYSTTNATLPMASWPLLLSAPGNVTNANVTVVPGANFFVIRSSNFWGLSDFSMATNTPAVSSGRSTLNVLKAP